MLELTPDYEALTVIQKVEAFSETLDQTTRRGMICIKYCGLRVQIVRNSSKKELNLLGIWL